MAGGETAELLAFNASPYDTTTLPVGLSLPLAPEPYPSAWERYAAEAAAPGAFEALRGRFLQLSIPIQEGISQTPAYRAATLRGQPVGPRHHPQRWPLQQRRRGTRWACSR